MKERERKNGRKGEREEGKEEGRERRMKERKICFSVQPLIGAPNGILCWASILQMPLSELCEGIIYLIQIKECFNII